MSVSSKAETDNQKDKKTDTFTYIQKITAVIIFKGQTYAKIKLDEREGQVLIRSISDFVVDSQTQ